MAEVTLVVVAESTRRQLTSSNSHGPRACDDDEPTAMHGDSAAPTAGIGILPREELRQASM
jgi:hypothetical protein